MDVWCVNISKFLCRMEIFGCRARARRAKRRAKLTTYRRQKISPLTLITPTTPKAQSTVHNYYHAAS